MTTTHDSLRTLHEFYPIDLCQSICRYYSNLSEAVLGYKLPLAYFLTGLAIYIYSFIATLRK